MHIDTDRDTARNMDRDTAKNTDRDTDTDMVMGRDYGYGH